MKEIDQVILTLEETQKWRRAEHPYDDETNRTMPYSPRQYGEALDYAIEYLKDRQGAKEQCK